MDGFKLLNTNQKVQQLVHQKFAELPDRSPAFSDDIKWLEVRRVRDMFLLQSDWTQFTDNSLTEQQRTAWAQYRQALRDITDQDVNNITWPTKPE